MNRPFDLFGAYSEGTLRPQDLIAAADSAATDLVRWLGDSDPDRAKSIIQAAWLAVAASEDSADDCFEAYGELVDAMDSALPPYVYYGADGGDGAYIGFLIAWDAIEDGKHFGDLAAMDDEGNVDDDDATLALHVNDHGNATLFERDGDSWREVWAVV